MPSTSSDASAHAAEIAQGERFAFGDNWRNFLDQLDDERIARAERSLQEMLGEDRLDGLTFLDVGCGSGLFSLVASRLGAKVRSFDFDPASVGCAQELKRRYAAGADWEIGQGSALDKDFLGSLGTWDIVYSWGVLHHTGAMWDALDNVAGLVAPGGRLFIAIYNDQGRKSRNWKRIKRGYVMMPRPLKLPYMLVVWLPRELMSFAWGLVRLKPMYYVDAWRKYKHRSRGMSKWHDAIDWIGGYPFEVASAGEIFEFYKARGFTMERIVDKAGAAGCNEFVLRRSGS